MIVRNTWPSRDFDNRLEKLVTGKLNDIDIIIIGFSRGHSHILASELERKLNLRTFNLSYGETGSHWHYFILKTYLKFNSKSKLIIKVLDVKQEFTSKIKNTRLDRLYPLVKYKYIMDYLIELGEKNHFLSKFLLPISSAYPLSISR